MQTVIVSQVSEEQTIQEKMQMITKTNVLFGIAHLTEIEKISKKLIGYKST